MATGMRQPVARASRDALKEVLGADAAKHVARLVVARGMPTKAGQVGAWLLSDLTVRIPCGVFPNPHSHKADWHEVVWAADGTAQPVDHAWASLDDEIAMSALAGDTPMCLHAWHLLERGTPIPHRYEISLDWVEQVHVLMLARAWQQHPDLTVADGDLEVFLTARVGPSDWAAWKDEGLDPYGVRMFLRERATVEQARPWIAAGLLDSTAAHAAAVGLVPQGTAAEWEQAGFTPGQAKKWIKTGLSPAACARLLPHTSWTQAVQRAVGHGRTVPDLITLIEAGVPPAWVDQWRAMPVDDVLDWQVTGLAPVDVFALLDVQPAVTPEDVLDWIAVGAIDVDRLLLALGGHAPAQAQAAFAARVAARNTPS